MKKVRIILVAVIAILSISSITLGAEHFLYDAENNKILYMDDDDMTFSEKIDMDKVPDLLMKTNNPDKYLAIYGPEVSEDAEENGSFFANLFKQEKEKKQSLAGQLILFNVKTGRTEDLVDIGYAPFNWEYSEDREHFFITYKVTDEENSRFELLHYNIPEMTLDKIELPSFTKRVNQLVISENLNRIYLLLDNVNRLSEKKEKISGQPEMLTVNIEGMNITSNQPLENAPLKLCLLGDDKAALLCQDWEVKTYYSNGRYISRIRFGKGLISYLDLRENKYLEQYHVDEENLYYQWFEEEKTFIAYYPNRESFFDTNYNFLKITKDGAVAKHISEEPLDFDYYPEYDKLYILNKDKLSIIDYQTDRVSENYTGTNTFKKSPYTFYRIPDSEIAVIYSVRDGKVKYYDLEKNEVQKKVLSGRTWGKIGYLFKSLFSYKTDAITMISTNDDKSNFYVYNRMSNDITVYNKSFQPENYVITPEPALGLYQVTEPSMKTLVFTGKKIYELKDEALSLIHSYEEETDNIFIHSEKNKVILLSDTELLVLDPETLKTENRIKFFVGRDEKYTKLEPGDQRYYFISTL